jgi:hypothetical protein
MYHSNACKLIALKSTEKTLKSHDALFNSAHLTLINNCPHVTAKTDT